MVVLSVRQTVSRRANMRWPMLEAGAEPAIWPYRHLGCGTPKTFASMGREFDKQGQEERINAVCVTGRR